MQNLKTALNTKSIARMPHQSVFLRIRKWSLSRSLENLMAKSMMYLIFSTLSRPDGSTKDDKIVGGNPVTPCSLPYQVSMQWASSKRHFCGGTILNKVR